MKKMKKIFSALTATVMLATAVTTASSGVSASYLYNDEETGEMLYNCVVKLSGDPLSEYDYAKENGVDEFIMTQDGLTAYAGLLVEHAEAYNFLCERLSRDIYKYYDYSAVYNGFSVVLSTDEYLNIAYNPTLYGVEDIMLAERVAQSSIPAFTAEEISGSYTDLTDKMLSQVGVSNVGYKGDSTVIAVIDNNFYYGHEYLSKMPDDADGRITSDFIAEREIAFSASSGQLSGGSFYYNEKIPFRFDYASGTLNGTAPKEHGTHVAGIAAGNGAAETDELYNPAGIAPNAQLALMSTSLATHELMAAYDDCAILGVDTINASFGVSYASVASNPCEKEAVENLISTGITFCAAAGNSNKLYYNQEDTLLNVDYATGGSPQGGASVISVASADNIVREQELMTIGDVSYHLAGGTKNITGELKAGTYEFVVLDGMGHEEEYEGLDVKGKIVFIPRGEITFDDKAKTAKSHGAVGVIFINDSNSVLVPECSVLPSALITFEDGFKIFLSEETEVTIYSEPKVVTDLETKISDFSSWGYTEELLLKPDITAFGGHIISASPDGGYTAMSGTSMACPQITGITALMKEYLSANKEKYGITSDADYPEIIADLLMSTATPVRTGDGLEVASPRVQGSGLVNIEAAMNTPAYLYTNSEKDNFRPKLSLGDGLETKLGTMDFSASEFCFNIKNVSDTDQTYTFDYDVFTDDVTEGGMLAENVKNLEDSAVKFKYGFTEMDEITVPAGEEVTLNLELDLSLADRQYIEETFENGTFLEGFVYLINDSGYNLTLPFMGFYGSWSAADIFEPFAYTRTNHIPSYYWSLMGDHNGNYAGLNILAENLGTTVHSIPAYSPNGDNVLDTLSLYLGFKRRCQNVTAEIYNNSTLKQVYVEEMILETGGWSEGADGTLQLMEFPINWDLANVKDGELYEIIITADKPLSDGTGGREILSQEFRIDLSAPVVEECRRFVSSGTEYMQLRVSDTNALQGAVLLTGEGDEAQMLDGTYCPEVNTKEYNITLKLPEDDAECYAEVYDMAGNSIRINVADIPEDKSYTLEYDANMYFSTNDKSFKDKISLTDAYGNAVAFALSSTPVKCYETGATSVDVLVDGLVVGTVPVNVGLAGDADVNEVVNLYDVIRISKYILLQNDPNSKFKSEFVGFEGSLGEYLADYDASGKINLYDAIDIALLMMSAQG